MTLTMPNKIFAGLIFATTIFLTGCGDESVEVSEIEKEPEVSEIAVYVSGQVKNPAVVMLEDNGNLRAVDAVNAAGGLTEFADEEEINLAEKLIDGMHIHIPTKEISEQKILPGTSGKYNRTAGEIVNINTADEKQLETLPGVGPATAQKIIDYRKQNGAFKSIDEIKKVRGIGEKKFEKLRDKIRV